jgi:hypothetical protein
MSSLGRGPHVLEYKAQRLGEVRYFTKLLRSIASRLNEISCDCGHQERITHAHTETHGDGWQEQAWSNKKAVRRCLVIFESQKHPCLAEDSRWSYWLRLCRSYEAWLLQVHTCTNEARIKRCAIEIFIYRMQRHTTRQMIWSTANNQRERCCKAGFYL